MKSLCASVLVTAAGVLLAGMPVRAAPIPTPSTVPGKEYSNDVDEDFSGLVDDLQNIAWDGLGGAVDTFDYSGSGPPPLDPDQVDALANCQDLFFSQVAAGTVPFLASFSGIDDIHYHDTTGAAGVWATGPVDINVGSPPDDVDALEVWGSVDTDDANQYSIIGDPVPPVPPGGIPPISVYYYDPSTHTSTPYIYMSQVQAALDVTFDIDIDALMVLDTECDGLWSTGDSIIFSLWPTAAFDGGEIWVWQNGGAASYLVHGGRTWDTSNPVGTIFGVPTENINAFEAVPEPGTLALLAAGVFAVVRRRRR